MIIMLLKIYVDLKIVSVILIEILSINMVVADYVNINLILVVQLVIWLVNYLTVQRCVQEEK